MEPSEWGSILVGNLAWSAKCKSELVWKEDIYSDAQDLRKNMYVHAFAFMEWMNMSTKQSLTCSVYNSLELKKNILNKKKIICGASDSYSHGAKGLGFATKFGK